LSDRSATTSATGSASAAASSTAGLDALSAVVLGQPERGRVGVVGELARSTVVGITAGQEACSSSTVRVSVSIWMRAKRRIDPPSHTPTPSRLTRFPAAAPWSTPVLLVILV
jgi:hypothetical protein